MPSVLRQKPGRTETIDFPRSHAEHSAVMIIAIFRLLSLIPTALKLRSDFVLENLALRQQLAVLKRQVRRPKLRRADRFFWSLLSRSWIDWKDTLLIVKPETVLRWHRKRFASYWTQLSRKNRPGRPGKDRQIRDLIRRMAASNPVLRQNHGHVEKIDISRSKPDTLRP